MTLLIDIGNTRTKFAWFGPHGVRSSDSMETGRFGDFLRTEIDLSGVDRVGLCSVVPQVTSEVIAILGTRPLFEVSHRVALPFRMGYRTPETLGNDRVAAAAAAFVEYREPEKAVLVVDAGTATTYEVISRDGAYLGGAIAPGPGLLVGALHRDTAQLPETVDLRIETAIGDSTATAIKAGVLWGFVDAVEGMIRRLKAEVGDSVVIATGGWAPLLTRHIAQIDIVDPELVLLGVAHLMEINSAEG